MRYLIAAVALVCLALLLACSSSSDNNTSPSAAVSPASASATATALPSRSPAGSTSAGAVIPTPSPDSPLYIALGDSLSAGVGASDPNATAFVPLVWKTLPEGTGLLNLGHSGDTSQDLISGGNLDRAAAEIEKRNRDDNKANDVTLLTLEIGGNDLLNLFSSLVATGKCPNLQEGLQRPECVNALRNTLDKYGPNLKQILDRLQQADPNLPIVLMTLYNPFSGGLAAFDPLGQLALEGTPDTPFPEGLNDMIRVQASGVALADTYPLFVGKAHAYIAADLIHPNDAGYRVLANTVIAAIPH